jgi:UDP:flavonoid glycosyltransferase YjiC (YdhE family)
VSDILVVTWDGGGNVPPALDLGRELAGRGHRVRVLGHAALAPEVIAAGLRFDPFATARPFAASASNSPMAVIGMFGDRAMGADVVAELDRDPADLVVVDCLLFGVMEALARRGTPYVVLEHLFDGYLRGPWLHGPIGLGLRLKRLNPTALLTTAQRCLVATLEDLDPGAERAAPANRVHTGPFVSAAPASPTEASVLVSLSTYRYPGMEEAMQRALDAVATLPVRVVATTGPVLDPARLRPGANTELVAWARHAEVMPRMSLVVGHGGHSTTMLALAHDLPLVVMPMHPFLDQPMVGRAVEAAGAGRVVRKKTPPDPLRAVIADLLADDGARQAAATLGSRIRELGGLRRAADLVEELTPNGARGRVAG